MAHQIFIYMKLEYEMFMSSISEMNDQIGIESGVAQAIFSAVKAGNVNLVDFIFGKIAKEKRELLYRVRDGKRRNILMSAVQHRQAEIFGMICRLKEATATLLPTRDNHGNNILHVAGTLTEFSPLLEGAALKMQTEVQWFKEVESLCNPMFSNERNYAGLSPEQVFMHTHKELMKEGEQWMKETASSCTVIGALIMTIMFAAAFTIPGGNNQDTGFPIFLNRKLFKIFIITDSVSLFSSSISVLMFLGILTSRTYEAKDFLKSLPEKMIIGLSTLLLSIGTMMIAFTCAILIMLREELWIVLPLVGLAIVPVSLYVFMLYGVLRDMIVSTYGLGTIS
ncbi:ankyrin repeat-containing protein ITN1-like [Juglans microcarpa x Juglans regia]|uniref:ankyrin repeat-containing protein ITN1-like n=1 Tax=Juglans microcarpa x Juglans regia TaxID=2249226 RepID=UPI001B7F0BAC|nr:ankyrin repeat-containing protein ITN1-like [Juglans microcarpa x Juglans regia]